jgi:hypothetical protein
MPCRNGSIALFVVIGTIAAAAPAATVTWDGGVDANNSGNWGTAPGDNTNWTGDANPGVGDVASLGNVTTGARTVTLTHATTVQGLIHTQTTAGAVNRLDLGATLSLSNTSPFASASVAGEPQSLAVNFGGNQLLLVGTANGGAFGGTLAGTWNFNSAGSNLLHDINAGDGTTGGFQTVGFTFNNVVNVSANAQIGRINRWTTSGAADHRGTISLTFGAGSDVNITSGVLTFLNDARGSTGQTNLTNGGAMDVGASAGVRIYRNSTGTASGAKTLTLTNQVTGVLAHAGDIKFELNRNSNASTATSTLNNAGVWQISGSAATITRTGTGNATLTLNNSGTLRGSSASDRLDYTGLLSGTRAVVSSTGAVSPGAGENGPGAGSIGTLDLRDLDLTLSGAGSELRIDLGGATAGLHDVLTLSAGDNTTPGTLTIDSSSKLKLYYVNGYSPAANTSWTILHYGNFAGQFDLASNLTISGASGFAADPANYSLSFGSASAVLTLVPEPAALSLMAVALPAMQRRRRISG